MNNNNYIPLDVPHEKKQIFSEHYQALTRGTGNLLLMAADQKIEHLMENFYSKGLPVDIVNPQHLFSIAQAGHIGALATHYGLISRYARPHDSINYIVKINGKTNLNKNKDPRSWSLCTVDDVVTLACQSHIAIRGVGFTIYLGSEFEHEMLQEAACIIKQAHQHGLVAILWIYPRGAAVNNERSGMTIAGAAGVACALGADFVKINVPENDQQHTSLEWLALAQKTAGNTKIICSGGPKKDPYIFLQSVYEQLHQAHLFGCAVGRNIFQYPLAQAVAISKALEDVIYQKSSLEHALQILSNSE